MKKVTLLLVVVFALFTIAAVAQDSGSSSSPSSTQQSSPDMSSQSSSQTSSQTSSGAGNSMEGCVVAVEKDYYLQPIDGSSKVKLTGSHDFSSDVGHHVKVKGTSSGSASSTNPSSAANPSASSGASASSAAGGQGQEFMVTEVDTVAESCPASGASPSSNPH